MTMRFHRSKARLHVVSTFLAAVAGGNAWWFVSDAGACSGAFAGRDFSVRSEVPQNGQVIGTYWCQVGVMCNFPLTMEVLDAAGEPVAGEVTVSPYPDGSQALYTFQPTQPWSVGETYSVPGMPRAPISPDRSTFTVVPALALDAEIVSAEPTLNTSSTPLNEVCCEESRDSCGAPFCVALEEQIGLTVGVNVAPPAEHLGQWLYRVHAVDTAGESTRTAVAEPVSPWGYPYLDIIERRARYCVQLELQNLVDGTTVLREPQCLEHGTSPDLGPTVPDLMTAAQAISQCDYPRPGTEEAWCVGIADRCEAGRPEDACERYDRYCTDNSATPLADTSNTSDAGCSVVQSGAHAEHQLGWGLLSLAGLSVAGRWRRTASRRARPVRPRAARLAAATVSEGRER